MTFVGGDLWTSPIRLFRIRGPIYTMEGGREGGSEILNEEVRVAASCQNMIKCYLAVLHTKYQVADGRWREKGRQDRDGWREGPDGWVSHFNKGGFIILIEMGFLF